LISLVRFGLSLGSLSLVVRSSDHLCLVNVVYLSNLIVVSHEKTGCSCVFVHVLSWSDNLVRLLNLFHFVVSTHSFCSSRGVETQTLCAVRLASMKWVRKPARILRIVRQVQIASVFNFVCVALRLERGFIVSVN